MNTNHEPLQSFRVRVGHCEIQVKARDNQEAVQIARLQLARELPRLYDVIRSLTISRFQVEAVA